MSLVRSEKKCSDCQEIKPIGDFFRNRSSHDGFSYVCKPCSYVKAKFAYLTKYRRMEKYKAIQRVSGRKWRLKNRVKINAYSAVGRNLANGKLIRPEACQKCFSISKLNAHHEDYTKQLDVIWLCLQCHAEEHHTHPTRR